MNNKTYNILNQEGNIILSDLDSEQVKVFIDTYTSEFGIFLIEEIKPSSNESDQN